MKFSQFSAALGRSRSSLFISLALGSVGVIILGGYLNWFRVQSQLPELLPLLPQDELIKVYFNHDRAGNFTEPYRQKTRYGTDLGAKHNGIPLVYELDDALKPIRHSYLGDAP